MTEVALGLLTVLGVIGLILWLGRRRAAPAVAPPPETPAVPPPVPPDEDDLAALANALRESLVEYDHPRELLHDQDFVRAVALARDHHDSRELFALVSAGDSMLACIALEAIAGGRDGADVTALLLDALALAAWWPRYFALRALDARGRAPMLVEVLFRADAWAEDFLVELLREFVAVRLAAGEEPSLADHLEQLPAARESALDTLLTKLRDRLPSSAVDEIRHWQRRRALRQFIPAFGRLWTAADPAELLVPDATLRHVKEFAGNLAKAPPRSLVVVGEPGVGKTTFTRALADRLRRDGWVVFTASAGDVNAGMTYIGQLEGRVQELVQHVRDERVLWIVPSVHELVWTGTYRQNPVGLLDLLVPHLESGVIRLVGETTPAGWEQLSRLRPRVAGLVHVHRISPLGEDETLDLARRWARLPSGGGDRFADSTIREAWQLARHYLDERAAPGNLLHLLTEACQHAASSGEAAQEITAKDLLTTISRLTGLPLDMLDERRPLDLNRLRQFFEQRVLGQSEAVDCLVERVAMFKAGLTDPARPPGVFLFVGPSGTGKTEIAKTLADFLFGSPDRMIRLDMSEFQTWESIGRILGDADPAGEASALVNGIRNQPFSVVLLDEFEKASRNVWNLFLQVFDDGRLTDRRGNTADFRHAIVIMTSNLGAAIPSGTSVGFASADAQFSPAAVERAVRQAFPPELINRIDRVVVFRPLGRAVMRELLRKELRDMLQRRGFRTRAWALEWDDSAIEFLLERGFTPDLGARPLRRAIERYVLAPLALTIVNREAPAGDQFLFLRSDGERIEAVFVDPDVPDGSGPEAVAGVAAERADLRVEELVLDPRGTAGELQFLQRLYGRLSAHVGAVAWQHRKQALLGRTREPGFWEMPDRFAILGLAEYMDRLEVGLQTAGSLVSRLAGARGRHGHRRFPTDLVQRLAQQLYLVDAALTALERGRPRDAFLSVMAGGDTDAADAVADGFAVRLGRMYKRWGKARRMRIDILEESGGDGVTPYRLVLAVSGFAAYPILEPESGVHVLETPHEDRGYARARARVTVLPQPDEPPAPGPGGARAQALAALMGRHDTTMVIARRYREEPSPLVRDGVRQWRTGRLDRVLDGDFDVIVERPV